MDSIQRWHDPIFFGLSTSLFSNLHILCEGLRTEKWSSYVGGHQYVTCRLNIIQSLLLPNTDTGMSRTETESSYLAFIWRSQPIWTRWNYVWFYLFFQAFNYNSFIAHIFPYVVKRSAKLYWRSDIIWHWLTPRSARVSVGISQSG